MLVIGLDFGSDSVRAIACDPADGRILSRGSALFQRFSEGKYCDPAKRQFRQHPLDYLEAMERAVQAAVSALSDKERADIRAIGTDTTGSTVAPVDKEGTPLALLPGFKEDPEAMFHMWKDHVSSAEGKELNRVLRSAKQDYLRYQGDYMGEWTYAKVLRLVRSRPDIAEKAASFVELSDWVPAVLSGNTAPDQLYRSMNVAAHKMLYHPALGGFPDPETMGALHPGLAAFVRSMRAPESASKKLGFLTEEWQFRFGLEQPVIVSGSSLDACAGAVGSGVRPGVLVKVLGTSGCDLSIADAAVAEAEDFRDLCGTAKDAILPGYYALESGQAAFGDMFAWVKNLLLWPIAGEMAAEDGPARETEAADGPGKDAPAGCPEKKRQTSDLYQELSAALLSRLEKEAAARSLTEDAPILLDWLNGRRYPVDDALSAAALDLRIGNDAVDLYRAAALGAVFGSRAIFDGFGEKGVRFERVIASGGIPKKSPYLMQLLADSFKTPVSVEGSGESCALGAAMYAAVAAGAHPDIFAAQDHMCAPYAATYQPDPGKAAVLDALYRKYQKLATFAEERS